MQDRLVTLPHLHSEASFATASQPKAVATASDSTVFVAEINAVEAVRSNQRVFELKPKFTPSAVAASGSVVAVGGEVSVSLLGIHPTKTCLAGPESETIRLGRKSSQGTRRVGEQQRYHHLPSFHTGWGFTSCGRREYLLLSLYHSLT